MTSSARGGIFSSEPHKTSSHGPTLPVELLQKVIHDLAIEQGDADALVALSETCHLLLRIARERIFSKVAIAFPKYTEGRAVAEAHHVALSIKSLVRLQSGFCPIAGYVQDLAINVTHPDLNVKRPPPFLSQFTALRRLCVTSYQNGPQEEICGWEDVSEGMAQSIEALLEVPTITHFALKNLEEVPEDFFRNLPLVTSLSLDDVTFYKDEDDEDSFEEEDEDEGDSWNTPLFAGVTDLSLKGESYLTPMNNFSVDLSSVRKLRVGNHALEQDAARLVGLLEGTPELRVLQIDAISRFDERLESFMNTAFALSITLSKLEELIVHFWDAIFPVDGLRSGDIVFPQMLVDYSRVITTRISAAFKITHITIAGQGWFPKLKQLKIFHRTMQEGELAKQVYLSCQWATFSKSVEVDVSGRALSVEVEYEIPYKTGLDPETYGYIVWNEE